MAKIDETKKEEVEVEEKAEEAVADAVDVGSNGNNHDDDVEASKLEAQIIRQIEYYFSDANLNRDKFLMEQIKKDEDNWVPFSVLITFKRLAALTTDIEVIANALMKSDEGLVEISDDKTKIRRHPERPIPEHNEERRKEIMSRTAYTKGFPLDITMSELLDFYAPYEKVLNVTMRKYCDKHTKQYKFKGSVFVTFEKKEQAQDYIEKDKVTYKDRDLIRKWQEKYVEEKREELKAKQEKIKNKKTTKAAETKKFTLPKGTVIHFSDAGESLTREILREALEAVDNTLPIAYIDYSKGDKEGHIRFQEENGGEEYMKKLEDKKLKLKDDNGELTLKLLEEDEEKAFLEKVVQQMTTRRGNHHKFNKYKGNNRKRRHGGNEGETESKKQKAGGAGDD